MGDSVRAVGAAGVLGHCPEDPQTHSQAEPARKLLTSQLGEQKLRVVEKESGTTADSRQFGLSAISSSIFFVLSCFVSAKEWKKP